jgi:hypothetical protein
MVFFMISIQVMGILSVNYIFELQEHTLKPSVNVELVGGLPALPSKYSRHSTTIVRHDSVHQGFDHGVGKIRTIQELFESLSLSFSRLLFVRSGLDHNKSARGPVLKSEPLHVRIEGQN